MPTILEEILIQRGWKRRVKPSGILRQLDTTPPDCIDDAGQDRMRLVRYAANDLPPDEHAACGVHLEVCQCCRDYLNHVVPRVLPHFMRLVRVEKRRRERA